MLPHTTSNANDTNSIKWTPPANIERFGRKHSRVAETDCPNNQQRLQINKKIKWSNTTTIQEHTNDTRFRPTIDLTKSDSPPKPPPQKHLNRRDILLESIKNFVESLPFYLHQPSQDMALTLLTCSDEFSRRKNTADTIALQENYIPISARFKHSLTSSKLLSTDEVFTELQNNCTIAVQHMQQTLRHNTISLQKREVYAARLQFQFKFIHHSLTITHMLLIHAKLLPKNKFLDLPFTDGHLAKTAFFQYLQSDTTAITKYLDCSFNRVILLLENHSNYKQDPYDLFPYTIPRNIDNDEDPVFPDIPTNDHTSKNSQNPTPTNYNPSNTPPHNEFDYNIPDTDVRTPTTNTEQPYDNNHNPHMNTPKTNNQNNFHINLTTHHGDNITNNFTTPSTNTTNQLQKTTLLPTFQSAASILQHNNTHQPSSSPNQNSKDASENNNQEKHSTNPNTSDTQTTNQNNTTTKTHPTVQNPYLKRSTPHQSPKQNHKQPQQRLTHSQTTSYTPTLLLRIPIHHPPPPITTNQITHLLPNILNQPANQTHPTLSQITTHTHQHEQHTTFLHIHKPMTSLPKSPTNFNTSSQHSPTNSVTKFRQSETKRQLPTQPSLGTSNN